MASLPAVELHDGHLGILHQRGTSVPAPQSLAESHTTKSTVSTHRVTYPQENRTDPTIPLYRDIKVCEKLTIDPALEHSINT